VHSADGWEDMLLLEIERPQKAGQEVVFRFDQNPTASTRRRSKDRK